MGRLETEAAVTALISPLSFETFVGRERIPYGSVTPAIRFVAAVRSVPCGPAANRPSVVNRPASTGTMNVRPLTRRPLKIPDVIQRTETPVPRAKGDVLVPTTDPPPELVHEPVSSLVAGSIRSPSPGTVTVTLSGRRALIASKKLTRAATLGSLVVE